jgi:hypothetical protein
MKLSVVRFTFAVAFTASQLAARAETLQIPEGGKAVPVGKDRVICGELSEGWTTAANRRALRPPETASATNRAVEVSIATSPGGCSRPPARLNLLATGPVPELDAASVSFSPDDGRVHFKGTRLEGAQIIEQVGIQTGRETCLAPTPVGKIQHCVVSLP